MRSSALPATHRRVRLEGFVISRFESHPVVESRMLLDIWGLSRKVSAFDRETGG
jgi:hypothetical protein